MTAWLWSLASALRERVERVRLEHRWSRLRELGMRIGTGVNLPASTWIDISHCYLISIGDHCGFGPECLILGHDAQMDEYLDAARIGRVIIHSSCHIGARTVILPGVEIGPRTIVGANSVVSKTLPPDTVCVGNPAKVVCSLEEYLAKHREKIASRKGFPYSDYRIENLSPERRAELVAAVAEGDAYITGGHSAELRGEGGMQTTKRPAHPAPPGHSKFD